MIGVDRDKLHTLNTGTDHAVDGVATAAAHTDNLNLCRVSVFCIKLEHCFFPPNLICGSPKRKPVRFTPLNINSTRYIGGIIFINIYSYYILYHEILFCKGLFKTFSKNVTKILQNA